MRYNISQLAAANSHFAVLRSFKMNLREVKEGTEYIVKLVDTNDDELNAFLFSLGCYSGEPITVVSRKKHSCIVSIKDGRYCIDNDLASAITV